MKLSEVTRLSMLKRSGFGARGTLDAPAEAREVDPRALDQLYFPDDASRIEAVHHLGEFGGPLEVTILGDVLLIPRGSVAVRRAAADALGTIGGPKAVRFLLDAFSSLEEPSTVRISALCALMELATGDWELYQMVPRKIVLREDLKEVFKAFRDDMSIGDSVRNILSAVD